MRKNGGMTVIVMSVSILVSVAGCDRVASGVCEKYIVPKEAQGGEFILDPLAIGYDQNQDFCAEAASDKLSPAEFEYNEFLERTKTGKFTRGLNTSCLSHLYSPLKLGQAARTGDPVAKYVFLLVKYRESKSACRDEQSIESALNEIGEMSVYQPVLKRNIARVPEAYESLFRLKRACRHPSDSTAKRKAEAQGFFLNEIAIQPL